MSVKIDVEEVLKPTARVLLGGAAATYLKAAKDHPADAEVFLQSADEIKEKLKEKHV